MRETRNSDQWTIEQRDAVAAELQVQVSEALDRARRLNHKSQVELKIAGRLLRRLDRHNERENELPF